MGDFTKPHKIVKGRKGSRGVFHLGDCVEVLSHIEPHSIDVIVTSPPYNLGIRYNSYDDTLSEAEYLEWTSRWIGAAAKVLKPAGSLFLNVGSRPSDPWTALDVAQAGRMHLRLQNVIHWIKSIAIDRESTGAAAGLTRDLAVGHYKPINSDRYLNDCHEFIFHFTPNGETRLDRLALGVPYQDQSNITRWRAAGEGVRCRGNTWFIPYETIQRRDRDRPHPATFPSRLPEQCLRLHGLDGIERVMDPFTGLGSTAVACGRLGLNFVGADLDGAYLTEAAERMAAATKAQLPARGEARMKKATASALPSASRTAGVRSAAGAA
jgi:site-specific DNA-methyltransferase (adenine-specific)